MADYVVVEFNQASGMPRLYDDDVYLELAEAQAARDAARVDAARRGRRERYRVSCGKVPHGGVG